MRKFHILKITSFGDRLFNIKSFLYRYLPKKVVEDSKLLGKEVNVKLEKDKIVIERKD